MIILPKHKIVIGHIPKTAGHALAVMFERAGIPVEHPYKIVNGRAFSTDKYKHETIDQFVEQRLTRPDYHEYKFFLVLRKLPEWMFSILWHYSVHTERNKKYRLQKVGIGKTYYSEYRQKQPHLPPPEILCYCRYGDIILYKHIPYAVNVTWLRLENLQKDIKKHLKISLPSIGYTHSYTHHSRLKAHDYWNSESISSLYDSNPDWSKLEAQIYGKLEYYPDLHNETSA